MESEDGALAKLGSMQKQIKLTFAALESLKASPRSGESSPKPGTCLTVHGSNVPMGGGMECCLLADVNCYLTYVCHTVRGHEWHEVWDGEMARMEKKYSEQLKGIIKYAREPATAAVLGSRFADTSRGVFARYDGRAAAIDATLPEQRMEKAAVSFLAAMSQQVARVRPNGRKNTNQQDIAVSIKEWEGQVATWTRVDTKVVAVLQNTNVLKTAVVDMAAELATVKGLLQQLIKANGGSKAPDMACCQSFALQAPSANSHTRQVSGHVSAT